MDERPIGHVPRPILIILALAFVLQLVTHLGQPRPEPQLDKLQGPPSSALLRLAAFGNPGALARLLMLRLQAADHQAGTSLSFAELDYSLVAAWLTRILELDPDSQYPLLSAVRVYGGISDESRARQMFELAYRQFLLDPNHRWRWLAESATWLKHRFNDPKGALAYARALRQYATGANVPTWATQMEIFILEDMDEIESARILLGALLTSGQVTDSNELSFLTRVMARLENRPSF